MVARGLARAPSSPHPVGLDKPIEQKHTQGFKTGAVVQPTAR
jgi:hypothetical protein